MDAVGERSNEGPKYGANLALLNGCLLVSSKISKLPCDRLSLLHNGVCVEFEYGALNSPGIDFSVICINDVFKIIVSICIIVILSDVNDSVKDNF
jgi:hypothetical protein